MRLERLRALPAPAAPAPPAFELAGLRACLCDAYAAELAAERRPPLVVSLARYNAGYRCRSCKRFVRGAAATCTSCGALHGGVWGNAESTR